MVLQGTGEFLPGGLLSTEESLVGCCLVDRIGLVQLGQLPAGRERGTGILENHQQIWCVTKDCKSEKESRYGTLSVTSQDVYTDQGLQIKYKEKELVWMGIVCALTVITS